MIKYNDIVNWWLLQNNNFGTNDILYHSMAVEKIISNIVTILHKCNYMSNIFLMSLGCRVDNWLIVILNCLYYIYSIYMFR